MNKAHRKYHGCFLVIVLLSLSMLGVPTLRARQNGLRLNTHSVYSVSGPNTTEVLAGTL